MKHLKTLCAITSVTCIFMMNSCMNIPEPIGKDMVGEYIVTYSYEVYDDPWEGGGSHTIVHVDTTFRIELSDTSGNFIVRTMPRYGPYILSAEYEDDKLIIPQYYFYPPGMTAHDIHGTIFFEGDSIVVDLDETFLDWPYGGTFYHFEGKGVRRQTN